MMLVEILEQDESGEMISVWEEPSPGSPAATKILALLMKVWHDMTWPDLTDLTLT